jgi:3-methyl-2-oxobutanoate hydroxymethyltransferase
MLGLFDAFTPKHAKRYAEAGAMIREALAQYTAEVKAGTFPAGKHSFKMDAAALAELRPAGHERITRRHALGLDV